MRNRDEWERERVRDERERREQIYRGSSSSSGSVKALIFINVIVQLFWRVWVRGLLQGQWEEGGCNEISFDEVCGDGGGLTENGGLFALHQCWLLKCLQGFNGKNQAQMKPSVLRQKMYFYDNIEEKIFSWLLLYKIDQKPKQNKK